LRESLKVSRNRRRLNVERVHADVQRLAVIEHTDFGALAGGRSFARFLLRELFDQRRLLPDLVVEHAIDFRRLIDADRRDGIALAMIVGGAVLVGLGEAPAGRSCENRQQSGQCFR
jgi:hypothetical protein